MAEPAKVLEFASAPAVPTRASPPAAVHAFKPKTRSLAPRAAALAKEAAGQLVPPIVTLALLLLIWQLAASSPTSSLPSPLRVLDESWDIIAEPFRVGKGIDQGLFWHVSASLVRVFYGFSIAAVVGIAFSTLR